MTALFLPDQAIRYMCAMSIDFAFVSVWISQKCTSFELLVPIPVFLFGVR